MKRGHVLAWDWPTRIFHWTLVVLLAAAWVSYEYAEALGDPLLKWHRWNGYAILILIVWRLLWGAFGSSTSRFVNFIPSIGRAITHARDTVIGKAPPYLGHNPLGALMVIGLLLIVTTQAMLGLFTVEHNDLTAGPLYRLLESGTVKDVSRWHRWTFTGIILPLIILHIAANLIYQIFKREPLITAMITGRKPRRNYADAEAANVTASPMPKAALLLLVAATIVFGTIWMLGGRLL